MQVSLPNEVTLESKACPLGCVENDAQVLIGGDRLHDLPGEYAVVRCTECGLMRTNPRPTPETMGFYYPDDYGPYQSTQVDSQPPSSIQKLIKKLAFRIPSNMQALPELAPGKLLEVGCASGKFLDDMSQLGWEVQGIEFSDTAASAARSLGHSVITGQVETTPDFEEEFDLIVGWMVIEHFHEPLQALQKLNSWCKPGGSLAISVPNAGSSEFAIFKADWYALQVPGHLSHFTPETIEKMLKKSGWTVEKVLHQRNLSNFIMSTQYWVDSRFPDTRLSKFVRILTRRQRYINLALFPIAWLMSCFGQTGRMTVWAKKPE